MKTLVSMPEKTLDYQPVIIIGAARSGTNMLRNCLTELDGVGTWPCDEINLIWRHGNRDFSSDEFSRSQANAKARGYIRRAFKRLARKQKLDFVIEKTCANSLRIAFIDEIFPEAKFIYIVRDGRDASASAVKRWKASIEIPYLLKKIRYTPLSDFPAYVLRFLRNRLKQRNSDENRQGYWGPRIADLEQNSENYSLAEVCSRQWVGTVKASESAFRSIPEGRVVRTKYEDFIENPAAEMACILSFLEYPSSPGDVDRCVSGVIAGLKGGWKRSLSAEDQEITDRICQPMLDRLGYNDG